jgi:acyl-CoA thioesterase-1
VAAPAVAPPPSEVLVVGDSIMKGYGLSESQAWPTLLADDNGWALTSDACNGAGFLDVAGVDCLENFPQIIAGAAGLSPSLVLIAGSSNDIGEDVAALQASTIQSFSRLRSQFPTARIIALNTFWGDTTPPPEVATIDAQVSAAVKRVGGSYLDVGQPLDGRPDLMQADDIHPTVEGQQLLEQAIFAALQQAAVDAAKQVLATPAP